MLIRNSEFNIGKADNSTLNTQNSTLPLASLNTQHSKLNIAKSVIERFFDKQGNETEMVVMKAENSIRGKSA